MALTKEEFKKKWGYDFDRDTDLVVRDAGSSWDGRRKDPNYVPVAAQARLRDINGNDYRSIYGTVVTARVNKNEKTMTNAEIHEALINSKPKAVRDRMRAEEAAKKTQKITTNTTAQQTQNNTQAQTQTNNNLGEFTFKNFASDKVNVLMLVKIYNKILTDPTLDSIKNIVNRIISVNGDRDEIINIFSAMSKEDVKNMIKLLIGSINADSSLSSISEYIDSFFTLMKTMNLTLDDIIDKAEEEILNRLHPEDDEPEEVSTTVAAVAPKSIIPTEVLDPNGQVISSIVKEDKKEDTPVVAQPEATTETQSQVQQPTATPATEEKKQLTFSPDDYVVNNKSYWEIYPKLEAFNKALSKEGFYGVFSDREGGLLTMMVVDMKTNVLERTLIVDPGIVYGDTVRILTNTNKDKDLRKELYIPVSSPLFKKILHGEEITKEERQEQMKTLPRAISDFRNQYSFLDRVDMSELFNVKITFKQWFSLVINISNVLINPNVPVCRFKLHKYENPNKFMLYVDDEDIKNPLNSKIMNEDSHKAANLNAVAINYDPVMYKDTEDPTGEVVNNTYVIGNISKEEQEEQPTA